MNGPRFDFRLERVRALRERLEDLSREELAASLGQRLRAEAELERALAEVHAARAAQLSAAEQGRASGHDLISAHAYVQRMDLQRRARAEDLSQREREVEERRRHLTEVARERQTLERLKERKREEHRLEAQRQEGLMLDELAISRHRGRAA